MGNILLTYIVVQLLSTAYGLSVIETVKPIVNQKLTDDGYILKNRNSMYKFNESITNVLKGFIPFYYCIKAVKLVQGSDAIERAANKEIKDGNYITREEAQNELFEKSIIKEEKPLVEVKSEPVVSFEKPERYMARKNDFNYKLLETNEEDVIYNITDELRNDKLEITPFSNSYIKPVVKEVTRKDIVNAIIDLNPAELDTLNERIHELSEVKKGNPVLKLKDVA